MTLDGKLMEHKERVRLGDFEWLSGFQLCPP